MAVKQKILIVDDDNNIAELISLYLTKECYDTRIVNDGEEALKAFASFAPNLILLDLMLRVWTATRCAGRSGTSPTCRSSCSLPKERSSIKSWAWNWGQTII